MKEGFAWLHNSLCARARECDFALLCDGPLLLPKSAASVVEQKGELDWGLGVRVSEVRVEDLANQCPGCDLEEVLHNADAVLTIASHANDG